MSLLQVLGLYVRYRLQIFVVMLRTAKFDMENRVNIWNLLGYLGDGLSY